MTKIYGEHNAEFTNHELASLSYQHRHLAEVACFDMQDLVSSGHRRPLLLTCALKFIQQFTGTAVIVSYMVIIFTNTGASREEALLFTALSSLPQLVTMILGSYFLDLAGRKKLLLMSQLGVIMTLVLMGFFQYFDGSLQTKAMILGVILFRVFYSLGLGPIPLVLASEILPFKIRGRGLAISTLLHSILGFFLTGAFPWFIRNFGEAPFYWGLAVVSVGGYYFIQRYIDETSNIRLEDLEALNHSNRDTSDITFHVHGQGSSRSELL
jgi:SP family arabinose:H+ symporter-like MFS transporter